MSERRWPVARCSSCRWDTRGRAYGAEPCAGIDTPGCLAAELAGRPKDQMRPLVEMLAGRQGSTG